MSDFEYDYNSDDDSNSRIDFSDDYDSDNKHNKYIIDMDSDNDDNDDNDNNDDNDKILKTSIINNSKSISTTFESIFTIGNSKHNNDSNNNSDTNNDSDTSSSNKSSSKALTNPIKKKIQIKINKKKEIPCEDEPESKTEPETEPEPESKSKTKTKKDKIKEETKNTKEIKLTKKEQSFEFNQETLDFYTKDLYFKKILVKNSPFTNDIAVICLLLKHNIITEYCCSSKKCKVKNVWLDNPIQLILHRKNNIQNDLSSFNLELICGNCYLTMYGLDIFKKKEKEIIFKCETCDFPLVKFNNTRKKKGICLSCEKKMSKVFTENIDSTYYSNIQGLYNDNPLLSEANKEQNYYRNSGKFKPQTTYKKPTTYNPSTVSKNESTKNTITLNMSKPNLEDLIH